MLKDDFYTILKIDKEGNSFEIAVQLNPMHAIYAGHFPGQPVVPGACMLQMVKEVTALMLEKELQLKKAENIKFLQMLNPDEHVTLQMVINPVILENGIIQVAASLSNLKAVCFRFNGIFQAI